MRAAVTRSAFVAAPAFLLAGVCAMKFGWKPNRDLDWSVALPLWTGAHVLYLAGYLAFGVVLADLWRRARAGEPSRRVAVDVLAVVGAVGLVAMLGQMVIDLLVGFRAGERAEMSAISRSYKDIPGFEVFFYGAVPAMQLTATALLIIVLAVRRQVGLVPALLFLVGSVAIATGSTVAMVAGGAVLCLALPATRAARSPGGELQTDRRELSLRQL
jgi:hypothetical protein